MGRRDAFLALLLEFLRKYCMEHEEVFEVHKAMQKYGTEIQQ